MQDEEDRQQSALAALMGGAAHALEASANRRDTYTVATEQAVIVVPRAQSASITIADHQLDEHEAFTFLVRLSQDSNKRMRVVAQEMIAPDANSPK